MATSPLERYEPLLDQNLQDHYQNPAIFKHLLKAGLVCFDVSIASSGLIPLQLQIDEKGQLIDKKTLKAREIKEARDAREKQLKEDEDMRTFNREMNVCFLSRELLQSNVISGPISNPLK